MDISITRDDRLLSPPSSSPNLLDDFLRPMAYTALQAPVKGLAQVAVGTDKADDIHLVEPPPKADSMSLRWHLQQTGAMVGMLAPIMLLHKNVTSKLSNRILGEVESSAASNLLARRAVLDSAITGALYEGVLQPINKDQHKDFVQAKMSNALIGGFTFGALTKFGFDFKSAYKGKAGGFANFAASDIGSCVLAGVPVGVANAELNSIFHKSELASAKVVWESAYSFSVLGGVLAGGKKVFGGTQAEDAFALRKSNPEDRGTLRNSSDQRATRPEAAAQRPFEYKNQRMYHDPRPVEAWESALPELNANETKAQFSEVISTVGHLSLRTDTKGRFGLYSENHSLLLLLPDTFKTANHIIVDSKVLPSGGLDIIARIEAAVPKEPNHFRDSSSPPDRPPGKRLVKRIELDH